MFSKQYEVVFGQVNYPNQNPLYLKDAAELLPGNRFCYFIDEVTSNAVNIERDFFFPGKLIRHANYEKILILINIMFLNEGIL